MISVTLLDAVRLALEEEMARDQDVLLLGVDIGVKGGVFRVTEGLLEKFGPERVLDAPLSGAALVGVGVGLALYGLKPVCEVQSADFIFPAVNQIINEAARIHYRSQGVWQVPMVIRAPYGGGVAGGLYHSQSVEAFFTHVPGLKVVIPSNPYDAKGLLKSAIRDPNPVLFLEPKKSYRLFKAEIPEEDYCVPIGPAQVTRTGSDVSVFCYGMMHTLVTRAAKELEAENIQVEVVDLRTLLPIDEKTILQSVRKTGKALVVHEDTLTGGYGAEIAARIAEQAFAELDAPVRRLAGPDVPSMPFSPPLQDWFMLNIDKIRGSIRALARF
jgi:2-oxoisovalerate dehydrogenase E1 component beta subunit